LSGARPLAIICGGGALPLAAAKAAREGGRDVFLVGLIGSAPIEIEAFPHLWVRLGELGKLFSALAERSVEDLAILGAVSRPEFADLKLDWGAVKRAADIARIFRGGDNNLLAGVARIFEREGFRIVGPRDFAPALLAPTGAIVGRCPENDSDMTLGAALLGAISPFDVGQGVVVANARVLAVEAAEGTDAMLARIADMRASRRLRLKGRVGVFVKAAKRGQDMRLDLPTIGPRTIEAAARAELAGIAIAAGEVLIADRPALTSAAEQAGLYIIGWAP
jgi:DUF1009 family protein